MNSKLTKKVVVKYLERDTLQLKEIELPTLESAYDFYKSLDYLLKSEFKCVEILTTQTDYTNFITYENSKRNH